MRYTMMIAVLCCAAACVSPDEHRRLQGEKAALKAQIAQLSEDHRLLAGQVEGLRSENQELGVDEGARSIMENLRQEAGNPGVPKKKKKERRKAP